MRTGRPKQLFLRAAPIVMRLLLKSNNVVANLLWAVLYCLIVDSVDLNNDKLYCIVLYSSIYIAPLNSHRQTEALLVRLAPRKETSFKK